MDELRDEAERLREQHQELRRQVAATADFSAAVHEKAAEVHDGLPTRRLDPADLREHAERDRDLADRERRALETDAP